LIFQAASGWAGRSALSWLCQTWQPNGGQVFAEPGAIIASARGRRQNRTIRIDAVSPEGWLCFVVCDGIGGMSNPVPQTVKFGEADGYEKAVAKC
jgi:hypothetical protein